MRIVLANILYLVLYIAAIVLVIATLLPLWRTTRWWIRVLDFPRLQCRAGDGRRYRTCGRSGNPTGRPKGSRSKLSEVLLSAVVDDFAKHGASTIEKVRETDPTTYLKIVCALVPREMLLKHEQEPPLDFTCPDWELMGELLEVERIKAGWIFLWAEGSRYLRGETEFLLDHIASKKLMDLFRTICTRSEGMGFSADVLGLDRGFEAERLECLAVIENGEFITAKNRMIYEGRAKRPHVRYCPEGVLRKDAPLSDKQFCFQYAAAPDTLSAFGRPIEMAIVLSCNNEVCYARPI